MPIIETKGVVSSQGYGQFARSGAAPVYIEDVFSTWLYTGNGSTQTITNGIDLATKGGLVWIKFRNSSDFNHMLMDTNRGVSSQLASNSSAAQTTEANRITSFNAAGFSLDSSGLVNQNNGLYASWTFAQQPKFFDVVTYTGNNAAQTIPHSLGSTPGCVIIKCINAAGTSWWVRHRSVTSNAGLLNSANAFNLNINNVPAVSDTSLTFTGGMSTNVSGETYVAYLFAHDAGGFGAAGTDNVISCGSFTTDGSGNATVNLGYEPQWLLTKQTNASNSWYLEDTMRGMSLTRYSFLVPNTAAAEANAAVPLSSPTATGFTTANQNPSSTFIYIAIRRGPMRTPTSGTSVFSPNVWTGNGTTGRTLAHGLSLPPDLSITQWRDGAQNNLLWDKLRGFSTTASGSSVYFRTPSIGAESPLADYYYIPDMTNVAFGAAAASVPQLNGSGNTLVGWNFRRAPGFFDVVCYTGTGANLAVNHNLGVAPEMMIAKRRNSNPGSSWGTAHIGYGSPWARFNGLLYDSGKFEEYVNFYQNPTATQFFVTTAQGASGGTYVAYLFASCPGVSKVGSYTGTGSTIQVDCGFTAGARFVLIKRTDATGDWYVWDSARGIVAGNDPYLLLNSIAAEVTSTDWVDTLATGFEVSNAGSNLVNVNGASYIFLSVS